MKSKIISTLLVATFLLSSGGTNVNATEMNITEHSAEVTTELETTEVEAVTEDNTTEEQTTEVTTEEQTTEVSTEEHITEVTTETIEETGEITEDILNAAIPTVTYKAHVANKGWMNAVTSGTVGTIGESKAIEALQISVSGVNDLGIRYRVQGQNYGWQGYKENGATAGTVGKALRAEAICIELTGANAEKFDVYYRVHSQNIGWLDWAKNGQIAGTYGLALRMEALQIVIVAKDAGAPGETATPCCHEEKVTYRAHCQNVGWQGYVSNGATSGTSGRALRMEAIEISVPDNANLGVSYRTHVQNIGWTSAVTDNAVGGTEGRSLRMEAINISLTGADASKFNIWYRVHIQNFGWLGWAKNGSDAGSTGRSLRIEAIQIKILPKAAGAPGTTRNSLLPSSQASLQARATLNRVGWDLRSAFNYSAGLRYYRNVAVPPAGRHLETYANYGFTNGCGNCYVMGATFCQMAREMGYEAYLVEGYVPSRRGGLTIHGWCEIKVDGKWYVCDPNFTNETGGNGYMINYGTSGTWRYANYSRVN